MRCGTQPRAQTRLCGRGVYNKKSAAAGNADPRNRNEELQHAVESCRFLWMVILRGPTEFVSCQVSAAPTGIKQIASKVIRNSPTSPPPCGVPVTCHRSGFARSAHRQPLGSACPHVHELWVFSLVIINAKHIIGQEIRGQVAEWSRRNNFT